MVKLSDLRADSWKFIVTEINYGRHPNKDDIANALERHEIVPNEAQDYIAKLLSKSISRGRPKISRNDSIARANKIFGETIKNEALIIEVNEIIRERKLKNADQALTIIAEKNNTTLDSVRRRYRKAVSDNSPNGKNK